MPHEIIGPRPEADVLRDQLEHLLAHAELCRDPHCGACAKKKLIARLLYSPFEKPKSDKAWGS